ncbi:MAG: hemerythrin [Patescibacteria group bacterium]|nr:hemerythrin [Patescibacteria group bacterium]
MMPLIVRIMNVQFTWDASMSVGDEKLDAQHQHLLEQVNSLLDALAGGKNNLIVIEQVLGFLDRYIEEHFTDEEHYMEEHQYPRLEEHRALHVGFIERYKQMKGRIYTFASVDEMLIDLEVHLGRWWIDHIGGADKDYAAYIRTRS